ncbi:ImmA/IrrE family metallo-endopeptidase [Enterococcus faecium]|uniref:ImmA/IrrE family metallo-endopeptidase n=1 Tax=Enterococcus faecium TaxID=1352 RepID=UPI0033919291
MRVFWNKIINAHAEIQTFNPIQLAKQFNLTIVYLPTFILKSSDGITNLEKKMIFLKDTLLENKKMFILAHEITHALNDSDCFHPNIEHICEKQADKGAVKLLVHFYFEIFSKENFDNIYILMDSMGIPLRLEDEVRKQIILYVNSSYCLQNVGYSCGFV